MATTEETLTMLRRIWDARELGYEAKVSVQRSWAGLEIFASSPDRRVVVYSDGHGWVSLDVPESFGTFYKDEEMTDAELLVWLELYLDAGIAYLEGRFIVHRSRRLRVPHILIETSNGPVRLYPGFKASIRAMLTRRRSQQRPRPPL